LWKDKFLLNKCILLTGRIVKWGSNGYHFHDMICTKSQSMHRDTVP
jgi:hypothetical protein